MLISIVAHIICLLLCSCRILAKAGYSQIWSLLTLIPIVNIFAVWIFAFAPWPILDSNDGHKPRLFNKTIITLISIFAIVLLLSFSMLAYQLIPEFIRLFKGLDSKIPILTKIIIDTYKYWVILPIIASLLSLNIALIKNITIQKQLYFLGLLMGILTLMIVLSVMTLWGMYAPIFALAE